MSFIIKRSEGCYVNLTNCQGLLINTIQDGSTLIQYGMGLTDFAEVSIPINVLSHILARDIKGVYNEDEIEEVFTRELML